MEKNILKLILQAESKYEEVLGKSTEESIIYENSVETKLNSEIEAVRQAGLKFEENLNKSFLESYEKSEKELILQAKSEKEGLKASKAEKEKEISMRIKNKILEELLGI